MRFLHTSDWHLGRSLYGRKRYEEFSAFLDWLGRTIEDERIDVLLVAGDIFDNSTPSNRAQELYYRFLSRVSKSCCSHVVIIGGNHDSPSFLNAPKNVLHALNIHVVGSKTEDLDDEVIVLEKRPQDGVLERAVVCAVPYLRDRDIRTVEPGETIDDKNRKLIEGVKAHYEAVVGLAAKKRDALGESSTGRYIPIIAMGHLFTKNGKTVDGDGVRELYVGSLAHVDAKVFPGSIDYLALGHLHVPQTVGSTRHIRYCGSPIPMGYGEATQEKKVVIIEFNSATPDIKELTVPRFQDLVRIEGGLDDIMEKLKELKRDKSQAWLEIEYTGSEIIGNLQERFDEVIDGSGMEILRIKNQRIMNRVITTQGETLDELGPEDVFVRCLDACQIPVDDRGALIASYKEILMAVREDDINAE